MKCETNTLEATRSRQSLTERYPVLVHLVCEKDRSSILQFFSDGSRAELVELKPSIFCLLARHWALEKSSKSPSQNGPPKSYGPVTKRFSSDASSLAGNEVVEWTLVQHNSHPNSLGSVVSAGPGRTMSMDCLDNCVVTVMTSSCHNQSEPLARLSKQTDNISSAVELEWFEWKQAQ
ncbi:hypothetical protein RRG08_003547 [Elysia crispata]|uniref:Uncharacterized protein n=1 Tax=Elysia crispata TaxID=231223 RepID=A0AAE0Y7G5_9GAST|nr:hypothetical protein RRG08_003547 [Elysia crispata]